ncbi:hypothetical protein VVT58_15135 [Sphingobium sp. SJ10-10]|uniref:hypothetical protein n=1 Tax=Sphingobium sp. SJ10-10 TaxID=3114999 RepID=UPI002E18136C|nr:hypothetical protein [Sphingobium sp. SJ10-10]
MNHDRLCAIGHNLADSMASGLGFVIGYYPMDVFGEAASSPEALIEIDFLNGRVVRGAPSGELEAAIVLYAEGLPEFCQSNGAKITDFKALSATFNTTALGRRVLLSVTDQSGRSSTTEYRGVPLKRLKALDSLGRIRKVPRQLSATNI